MFSRSAAPTAPALALALALVPSASACSKRSPSPQANASASAPSSSASAAPLTFGPQQLDTPTAFEFAPSRDGATLVWAPADPKRGALLAVDFEGGGSPKPNARTLLDAPRVRGDISDLGSAWVEHELAVAWVEREGPKARVRATWATTGRVFELGPAWAAPRTARGNLVVGARGGAAVVFARGDEAPCIEPGRRGCFGFSFHELRGDRADATGLPLSVPVPCTDNSAVFAVAGARFHYGVCTDTGKRPVTTLFTIQRDPEYARADTLLEGCEPAGTLAWDGALWLIGECEGQRRAVRLGAENEPAVYLDLRAVRLECSSGSARLRASGFELALDEPRGALQALLPAELAPRGSRAVWTGRALLIGTALGDELRVTRRTCQGERLQIDVLDTAAR